MFLRNSWYVGAWSRELSERPLAVTMLSERVVLFRQGDGRVGALADRCPHRHLPLSRGQVTEEGLQCGYPGMSFASDGRCTYVASQPEVPPGLHVRAYPALERYGWVWVWMGEPEKADPDAIPDFHYLDDPSFAAVGKPHHVAASYLLVNDNLRDLSHVGYVHTSTIGNAAFTQKGSPVTARRTERGVEVKRLSPDVPPPPTYLKSGQLPAGKNIDRWQVIDFIAPCFIRIHVGGAEVGTGALEGRYDHGLNLWVMNAVTPETETSCNYFWAAVRRHALGDSNADALFLQQVSEAFEEDCAVLEAQQQAILEHEDSWTHALQADAGAVQARRVVDRLIDREQQTASISSRATSAPMAAVG